MEGSLWRSLSVGNPTTLSAGARHLTPDTRNPGPDTRHPSPPFTNECQLHGDEGREPWAPRLKDIEVVRCDHLGPAYVVEMYLVAGSEASPARSHHIHFVRGGLREVHALDEGLSREAVERVWNRAVAAMEGGAAPNDREARFHRRAARVAPS